MDIFDFALKMELDGEQYYRDLAAGVRSNDLRIVLESLAEDEQRHYEIIQSIQQRISYNIEANPLLGKIHNTFVIDKHKGFSGDKKLFFAELRDEQINAYQAALIKENESVDLYRKLKEGAKTQEEKIICEKLMSEEEKHVEVMETIIEMLNHVHDWVEAAEFNHQDLY